MNIPYEDETCDRCGVGKVRKVNGKLMRRMRIRFRPDLSGRAMANELGISAAYLSDMELGRRVMSEKIANMIMEIIGAGAVSHG